MTPRSQILVLLLACILTILTGTHALAWWASQAAHEDIVSQRDSYLLQSLRTATENYLAIGLSIEQMDALQGLIERERAGFPRVLAIDVFAASGTVLYSTDPNALGSAAPERWRENLLSVDPWRIDDADQRQIGVRFDSDLGQAAGGVVVTVSTAAPAWTLAQWQAQGQIALQMLGVLALACLCAWIGAALGLQRLLAPFERIARILENPPDTVPQPASPAQEHAAHHTVSAWAGARQNARQRLQQLQDLDDAQ